MKNEKSTFCVLFYLKKDKMKKNGLVPIHARITIDGKQTQFNTKLEVLETNWQSGRAVGKTMEIQRLNSMLDDIKANIRSHFHNQLMRDSYVTPESVKNALLGKEEEALTIISFFEQHNDQYKKKVEAGEATQKTYSRYELTKLRLTQEPRLFTQYGNEVHTAFPYSGELCARHRIDNRRPVRPLQAEIRVYRKRLS